jgi:ribosomal protein L12E/L44/L45/RPP1/RPP2
VPVATGNTVIAAEDVPLVIGAGDFNFTDVESDSLASVTITGLNLNGGTLTHSAGAVTVTNGMTITVAQLADLTFTSAANNSTNSSFTYTVNDAGIGVTSAVMNITVNAVNDVPVATGNTVIASEDVPRVIGVSDFNFTDVELDSLASVTITGLNLNGGTLTHSAGAVTVTNGMTITAAQLADLTFTSAANDSTNSSFTYTVNDAGTGVTSAVMNITVNAVNDVPVATGNTVIASEDVPLVIGPSDFNFTDVESDSLASVTITGLNLNGGTLTHSGGAVAVTNGMTITAAQLADLTFTSAANDSTNSSFTYTVNDAGIGVTSAVMNITVNAVNDVPVATGNTVIASEDVPLVIGAGDFNFTDVESDSLASVTITGLNMNGRSDERRGGTVSHSN